MRPLFPLRVILGSNFFYESLPKIETMNSAKIPVYEEKIQKHTQQLQAVKKQHAQLGWIRLAVFLLTLISWFYILTLNLSLGIGLGSVGILAFAYLLKKHKQKEDIRKREESMLAINQEEKACCEGQFLSFGAGEQFVDHQHPYAYDIDLFGKGSLFQYINRTTTVHGERTLAHWLGHTPLPEKEILQNQEAIAELAPLLDFRQAFQTIGKLFQSNDAEESTVNKWLATPLFFKRRKLMSVLLILAILVNLSILTAVIARALPFTVLIWSFLINLGIIGLRLKKFNRQYEYISKSHLILKKIAHLILLIEEQEFQTTKLQELQVCFKHNTQGAGEDIQKLTRLLGNLDQRNNLLLGGLLNAFFWWDWQYLFRIEKWQLNHQLEFSGWLSAMAEFDALNSLANLHYNNPDFHFPKIVSEEHYTFDAKSIGHPLLLHNKRVCNDFDLNQQQRYAIVTGANMAGKSTFLRTIATNLVLAGCGAPVCAESLTLSPLPLHSSMRAEDSLLNNESYFFAELKRLQKITKALDKGEKLFIILDEILRGTNSEDKRKGSIGFVKKITQRQAHGLVATHDLELARLAEQQPETFKATCFEVSFKEEELQFNYKLQPGVTQNMNASFLMQKMGIIDQNT